ncbi:hypothetical protein TWF481_000085 [Arthrobotrys musiformis]|uniref:F-box domain-containing protein n=1 Tax=Arthrobotrys musiformis TaxID=47236 RepID=A0AAV9WLX5_9PEZI
MSVPRATILDLPNELLIPIFQDVVASLTPQETIRSGIIQLSWTCRRFHQVMQYFLESTCFVGVSIPARQSHTNLYSPTVLVEKTVNVSYRLFKYNTKGARGPFVKKLDIYGGFRREYPEYRDSQKRQYIISRPKSLATRLGGRGPQGSHLDVTTRMLNTVYNEIIHGFKNLTIASIQNTPDSLFVHLIPGLQSILAHCPRLVEVKLFLTISIEKSHELQDTLQELVDNRVATCARLVELDLSITEESRSSWKDALKDSEEKPESRIYPIEILTKVFGASTDSLQVLKANYIVSGSGSESRPSVATSPLQKWAMPSLKSLQFPVTSWTTNRLLTEFCEINYAGVQEITFNGLLDGNWGPDNDGAVNFLHQFPNLKVLNIEAISSRNLAWVQSMLIMAVSSFFPSLRVLEIRTKVYFWRELEPVQRTNFKAALENFALRHGNSSLDIQKFDTYLTGKDVVFRFSIAAGR